MLFSFAFVSLAFGAGPPVSNEGKAAPLPSEAKYLLDLYEAHWLAEIRFHELTLTLKSKAKAHDNARKELRSCRRKLYKERIDLVDQILHDPKRWVYQELSAQEKATLRELQQKLRDELKQAIQKGIAEKDPPMVSETDRRPG